MTSGLCWDNGCWLTRAEELAVSKKETSITKLKSPGNISSESAHRTVIQREPQPHLDPITQLGK